MRRIVVLSALAAVVAAAVGAGYAGGKSTVRRAAAVDCGTSATIGYFGPTTGPAASIGEELRRFSLLYSQQWNAKHKLKFKVVEGDTQFDPAQVSTIAQQFASNGDLLAVIGPGASQEVLAAKPILKKAGLAYIAASATRVDLTTSNPTFFRIAAPDSVQAKSTSDFLLKRLHVKQVFVIDDQSAYSVPLANEVQKILNKAGVKTKRTSVKQAQSDFSSVITDIPSGTDLVYAPMQIPAKINLLGNQLKEQGKRITIFASDAGYSPDFKIVGSYFSTFGPDVRTFAQAQGMLNAFWAKYGKKAQITTFGPLGYITGQVIVDAVAKACADGTATRAEVLANVRKTNLKSSVIGQPIKFTAKGERVGASFFTFKITSKGPVTVK
jgi:branched-chain amino acid transport system substrate-binding protein